MLISGPRRLSYALKRNLRRRAAVKPEMGHMTNDGMLGRNFLNGMVTSAIKALPFGTGYNLREILARARLGLYRFLLVGLETILQVRPGRLQGMAFGRDADLLRLLARNWRQTVGSREWDSLGTQITDSCPFLKAFRLSAMALMWSISTKERWTASNRAQALVQAVPDLPETQGARRVLLVTRDAHGANEKLGFERISDPAPFMHIYRKDINRRK